MELAISARVIQFWIGSLPEKKDGEVLMRILDKLQAAFARTPEQPESAPVNVNQTPPGNQTPPDNRRINQRIDARKGTRVLIIDDSPTILTSLRKTFSSAGYLPLVAANAERGLKMAHTEHPDLVILDVLMPGMNGFAALRQIRRDPAVQHLPVIMMSGNEQVSEQIYVMRIGADGFMKKPFSRFDIFSRVEKMLDDNRVPRRVKA